jgi:enamine deaminase RidA (YjgF/YER057c/UK114 family)
MRTLAPAAIRPPFAAYSHGVEVPSGCRWVLSSGQLGIGPDDTVPAEARDQADLCFANCAAILAEAGMGPEDVVRINAFVTDRAHMPAYMAARDAWLAGSSRKPASTLVIVSGFTRPEFLVEVEVTAARI